MLAGLVGAVDGCAPADDGRILVSAAASLADAFDDMASAFEAAHPEAEVVLNLAGSSALRAQIVEGAPVDVFASADPSHTDRLAAADMLAGNGRIFATNRMRIAVPPGNPAGVKGLADLGREDLVVGLCAPTVPCGDLARRMLDDAGVVPAADTDEPDVRALLTKVELGELDVAVVYETDVTGAAGRVEGVDVPAELNARAEYAIAVVADAPNRAGALAFVGFVLSPEGQAILGRHGFTPP